MNDAQRMECGLGMADSRAGGGGNGEMLPKGIDLQLVDKQVGDLRHSAGTPPVYRNHRTC